MISVVPINDCQQHVLSTTCNCGPRVEFHETILVIHSSFDGRECFECDTGLPGKQWEVIDGSEA